MYVCMYVYVYISTYRYIHTNVCVCVLFSGPTGPCNPAIADAGESMQENMRLRVQGLSFVPYTLIGSFSNTQYAILAGRCNELASAWSIFRPSSARTSLNHGPSTPEG